MIKNEPLFVAPLKGLESESAILPLDFCDIPKNSPPVANISHYFAETEALGEDPRSAPGRQKFNDALLKKTNLKFLVSKYGEDRSAMLKGTDILDEKRFLHLGYDIFSQDLESVYSPCDGTIVMGGRDHGDHSFGNFIIIQPNSSGKLLSEDIYIFLGHLSSNLLPTGVVVRKGQLIGSIGDFSENENGGWSRHLHLQLFTDVPSSPKDLIGYSSSDRFDSMKKKYPNPSTLFPFLDELPLVSDVLLRQER